MKKIIYFTVLILILQGCSNLDQSIGITDRYDRVNVIKKAKVYSVPVNSHYALVDVKHKKMLTDSKVFLNCNIGDVFWNSSEYAQKIMNIGFTPENLKLAEFEHSAGCEKASLRVY